MNTRQWRARVLELMTVSGLGRYRLWLLMREHGFKGGYAKVQLALQPRTKDVTLNLADLIYRIAKDEADRLKS